MWATHWGCQVLSDVHCEPVVFKDFIYSQHCSPGSTIPRKDSTDILNNERIVSGHVQQLWQLWPSYLDANSILTLPAQGPDPLRGRGHSPGWLTGALGFRHSSPRRHCHHQTRTKREKRFSLNFLEGTRTCIPRRSGKRDVKAAKPHSSRARSPCSESLECPGQDHQSHTGQRQAVSSAVGTLSQQAALSGPELPAPPCIQMTLLAKVTEAVC